MATEDKTCIKGMGFCSFGNGSNAAEVDVKDGKVVRIRPLRFDKEYTPEEMNAWQLKARGKVFKPKMKSLNSPFHLAYKKCVILPTASFIP